MSGISIGGSSPYSNPALTYTSALAGQDSQLLGSAAAAAPTANLAGITSLTQSAQNAQSLASAPVASSAASTLTNTIAGQDATLLNGVSSGFSTYL